MNKLVLYSVSVVVDGSEAEEGWQYVVAVGKSKYHTRSQQEVKSLQREWCVVCVWEKLRKTRRYEEAYVSAERRGASLWKSRLVLCSGDCARDGSGVLGASVYIR